MQPPKLPSLVRLRKARNKVVDDLKCKLEIGGMPLVGRVYDSVVDYCFQYVLRPGDFVPGVEDIGDNSWVDEVRSDAAHRGSRLKSISYLLSPFRGLDLEDVLIRKISIALTGRVDEIRGSGIRTPVWEGDVPSTSLLYVRDVCRKPARNATYGIEIEAFTGPASAGRWVIMMTHGRVQHVMRDVGAYRYEKTPCENFSGFWFVADITYASNNRLILDNIEVSEAQKRYNRDLTRARKLTCPGGCSSLKGKTCVPCPVSRAKCPRSRFSRAFATERQCINGHPGLFRNGGDKYCFTCTIKGNFKLERNSWKN